MFFKKYQNNMLLGLIVAMSIIAWYISYSADLILVYNDAMSHMNIPRLVLDNRQPGFAQLGSVWLPLSHILTLPLVWNNWAWQSGFAGSLVSMASYVFTVVAVYKILLELTKNRLAAVVGAIAAALNVDFLYLQSTPLTEPLYVALFSGSVYFLIRALKTLRVQYLIPLAALSALQIMTRYDGWFVAACIALILLANELFVRRSTIQQAIGHVALFAVPVAFTCLLWFGWNAVIYGDPLYFATGPYSAKAQQTLIEETSGLESKGDVLVAVKTFGYTIANNIGWLVLNAALIGWLIYLNPRNKKNASLRLAAFGILGSVIVFNILALVLGFSIIRTPELYWDTAINRENYLFNVRYGILALPFAAIGVGLLVAKWRYTSVLAILIVAIQGVFVLHHEPITLRDGLMGSSAYVKRDIARELQENVGPNDDVLVSLYGYMPSAFDSSLQMNQFVHEGVSEEWPVAITQPQTKVKWILMSSNDDGDPVYSALVTNGNNEFLKHYSLEYESTNGRLYRLHDLASLKY